MSLCGAAAHRPERRGTTTCRPSVGLAHHSHLSRVAAPSQQLAYLGLSEHFFSCTGAGDEGGLHASQLGPIVLFVESSMHSLWLGQQKSPIAQSSSLEHE